MSDLLDSFNIDLVEASGWVILGELFEDGADHPARATPRSPKVEDVDPILADLMTGWSGIW